MQIEPGPEPGYGFNLYFPYLYFNCFWLLERVFIYLDNFTKFPSMLICCTLIKITCFGYTGFL